MLEHVAWYLKLTRSLGALCIVALVATGIPARADVDLDGNGRVDAGDLLLLQEQWHEGLAKPAGAGDQETLFEIALRWHLAGDPAPTTTPGVTLTPTPTPAPPVAAIERIVVSPRLRDMDAGDTFDASYNGEQIVGIGQKVYFSGRAVERGPFTSYTWSIAARPFGSTTTIEATGDLATFRPDLEGEYMIRLVAGGPAGTAPAVQIRSFAAKYVGTGTLGDNAPDVGKGQCAVCHPGNNGDWKSTEHARIMPEYLNGLRGASYNLDLLEYHVVGYNPHALAAPSQGFLQVAAANKVDPATLPVLIAEAALAKADPNIPDVSNFDIIPAPVQNKMSVQCENCHGPASRHFGNKANINPTSFDQRRCAVCHDTLEGGPLSVLGQWDTSAHPHTSESAEGHVQETASCRPCHTAEGFVEVQIDGGSSMAHDEFHAVTCAACHDPHGSTMLPSQLRRMGSTALPSGEVFGYAGKGGLCVSCHVARVSNATTTALGSFRGAHHGPQADMLLGANGYTFGQVFGGTSVHAFVVLDTCVACHMNKTESRTLGGHSFALRDDHGTPGDLSDDTTNVDGLCTHCHTGLGTLDRAAGAADWDGDGTAEGTQSEMRGLMAVLHDALFARIPELEDMGQGQIEVPEELFPSLTDVQKGALYNYRFVYDDGSSGVHNTGYAIMLLQESYRQLTGSPVPGAVVIPLGRTIPWKTEAALARLRNTPGMLYRTPEGGAGMSDGARKALLGVYGSLESSSPQD